MKLNSILSVFAPKDVKFFPLLDETADILDQSARLLTELFASGDNLTKRTDLCRLIKEEEVKGDRVTGGIFKALNLTFITPFDREDIGALADSLDDAIDTINRAAHKVLLYTPENLVPTTLQLAHIVRQGTTEIKTAVSELSNVKHTDQRIRAHAKEIKRLEEEADTVYEKGITELFHSDLKAIELIKLKEIIQELEKATNKINTVGKVLKTIIVKYA
jgi:predicted phosphate transport protein (TIGR00153 family)